jgi:hypothetical protein
MKFLKEDGTIDEGLSLSDQTIEQIEHLEELTHLLVCGFQFHSSYSIKPCRKLAIKLVTECATIDADALFEILEELKPKPEPEPAPVVEIVPLVLPTMEKLDASF